MLVNVHPILILIYYNSEVKQEESQRDVLLLLQQFTNSPVHENTAIIWLACTQEINIKKVNPTRSVAYSNLLLSWNGVKALVIPIKIVRFDYHRPWTRVNYSVCKKVTFQEVLKGTIKKFRNIVCDNIHCEKLFEAVSLMHGNDSDS